MGKKDVSQIVSGAGLLAAVWTDLDRAVRERGGSDKDLYRLNTPDGKSVIAQLADVIVGRSGIPTTYNQLIHPVELLKLAMGDHNANNINPHIVQKDFSFELPAFRTVNLRVEAYYDNEASEQAARRLTAAGHTLASSHDLVGFLYDHSCEISKWIKVLAISDDSQWKDPACYVYVPYASVRNVCNTSCSFDLEYINAPLNSCHGALVIGK